MASQTRVTGRISSEVARQIKSAKKVPLLVMITIVGLLVPLMINVGPLRLTAYRIVLLLLFFPALIKLLSGKAGKITVPDVCVILICIWSAVSLMYLHGLSDMIEAIGILVVETLGAYLVGRCYIRTPEQFYSTVKLFFLLTVLIAPLALFETATGRNITLELFDKAGTTYVDVYKDKRWGLDRVQSAFAHPIHFGVFFGSLIGITHYVLGFGKTMFGRLTRTGIVAVIGALALSSGPLAALVAQVFFLGWDFVLRKVRSRWYILAALSGMAYVTIDLLSNRNPFEVFISYLAFNADTAYNRILIWEWGTKNIFDNPVFGIGFNTWERGQWMTASADMFWIVPGMRHGIIVWFLYLLLFGWIFFSTANAKISDPKVNAYRTGFLATMFGLFMAGWTVHYWDATLVLLMFLMSTGMWITDKSVSWDEAEAEPPDTGKPRVRFSRFENAHARGVRAI